MLTINPALSAGFNRYIIDRRGSWSANAQACADDAVRLANDDDEVAFVGPLNLNLAVLAENQMQPLSGGDCACQSSELMSYDVEIPAGHTWRYSMRELNLLRGGANRGCSVIIRPNRPRFVPPTQATTDLPCDYAVEPISDTGVFFPAACEPCGSRPVRLPPPSCGPRLDVPPATGGCVRPRFFTGMSITREDMETELRYLRLKLRLHNRATGQGVVWGLDAALRGNAVVVGPGYGIDGCGNDLTVTCDYAVSAAALLSDPAICRQLQNRGDGCFALLLEYLECPEAPRPVHGDGCVPAASACEMSRVRETVRLRLVPPRKLPPTPLGVLLAKLKQLDGGGKLLDLLTSANQDSTPSSGAGGWQPAPAGTVVPWQFHVTTSVATTGVVAVPPTVPPAVTTSTSISKIQDVAQVMVEAQGATFTSGTITVDGASTPLGGTGGQVAVNVSASKVNTVTVSWETGPAGTRLRGTHALDLQTSSTPGVTGNVTDTSTPGIFVDFHGSVPAVGQVVRMIPPTGGTPVTSQVISQNGNLTIVAFVPGVNIGAGWTAVYGGETLVQLTARPAPIERFVSGDTPPLPCCDASCCADEERIVTKEMLLLVAALAYGKVLQILAQKDVLNDGDAAAAATVRNLLRKALESSGTSLEAFQDIEALFQELYRTWCAAAIYDGPHAEGDPDGVVIGCAHVRAGALCSVDPLAGRRWVIHQPLLDHWAAQFGFDPLDRTVTQLFARLCCVSHLPGLGDLLQAPVGDATGASVNYAAAGEAYAGMSAPEKMMRSYFTKFSADGPLDLGQVRAAGLNANVNLNGLLQVALSLIPILDLRGLAILGGLLFCPKGISNVLANDPQTPSSAVPADIRKVSALVDQVMMRQPEGRAAPVRLSATASGVTQAVLAAVPLSAVKPEAAVGAALAKAKVNTVSDLLANDPESLHTGTLAGEHGAAFDATVQKARDMVDTVAKAVNETTTLLAKNELRSGRDLAQAEVLRKFSSDLTTRLEKAGLKLDPKAVKKAVQAFKAG